VAGWIKLYRDIVTKDIYLQDPLYARVFERLIIEANHACKLIPYKGTTKLIKRGEKLTSIRQIAEWVGWYYRGIFKVPNPKTIAKILDWMVLNGLIEIINRGNSQETHYNVLNYCIYQSVDDIESNAQVTVRGEVKQQCADTNNNVNNDKNEKKSISSLSSNKFSDDAIEIYLACELYSLILLNNPNIKNPNLQVWAKQIDLMIRADNRSVSEIQEVIRWCQKDSFWQANILSTKKLREKYDQLTMKMKSIKQVGRQANQPVQKNVTEQWSAMRKAARGE